MIKATSLITAATLFALAWAPAQALPFVTAPPSAPPISAIVMVQANCNAVGQRKAAQLGGTLNKVRAEDRGGRVVCVGEVIVPPRDNKRGEKVQFEEPL